jgi:hypothetical protein
MVSQVSRLLTLCMTVLCFSSFGQGINITGTVKNQAGKPLGGVTVHLKNADLSTTTDSTGAYALTSQAVTGKSRHTDGYTLNPILNGNRLSFNVLEPKADVHIRLSDLKGRTISRPLDRQLPAGEYDILLPQNAAASQVCVVQVSINGRRFHQKTLSSGRNLIGAKDNSIISTQRGLQKKNTPSDTLIASLTGYHTERRAIVSYVDTCNFTLTAGITIIAKYHKVAGTLPSTVFRSIGNYGISPSIMLAANPDNSFDIAWHEPSTARIHILRCDSLGDKVGEMHPDCISGAGRAVGFAKIPEDDSYVLGYAKDNEFGNKNFEFWITRFNNSGTQIYSTRIFGEKSADSVWAKGEPGTASSGRMVYNPASKRLAFYCGHSMKWDDNVRHQGGYMGFLDEQGAQLSHRDDWYCSHNFDQRILLREGFFYTLAHGDAYPRSLVFAKWADDPAVSNFHSINAEYFKIPGAIGDNTTNTQTGGMVWLHDTTISAPGFTGPVFGVLYGTKIGRSNYDICFKRITGGGTVLDSVWLTSNPTDQFSMFPRIARFTEGTVLVAWHQSSGGNIKTQATILDYQGQTIVPPLQIEAPLSEYYDLVNLPNGDIVWAVNTAADTIGVFRIPAH